MTHMVISQVLANSSLFKELAFGQLVQQGQRSRALVVACCDWRSDPALLAECDPAAMFVVRNVANLVLPYVQATYFAATPAIAFAVHNLEVGHIIVMEHAQCGGIRALMEHKKPDCNEEKLIAKWRALLKMHASKYLESLMINRCMAWFVWHKFC